MPIIHLRSIAPRTFLMNGKVYIWVSLTCKERIPPTARSLSIKCPDPEMCGGDLDIFWA